MTGRAIGRNLTLPMAAQTETHICLDGAHRHRLLAQIAVTTFTGYLRANMGGVPEEDMRRILKIVNALPRDLFTPRQVARHLLDLRPVRGHCLVTRHAELHPGNSRTRTLFHARVAIRALESFSQVYLVGERDGLDRQRPPIEELLHRVEHALMGGGEYGRVTGEGGRAAVLGAGKRSLAEHPDERSHSYHEQDGNSPSAHGLPQRLMSGQCLKLRTSVRNPIRQSRNCKYSVIPFRMAVPGRTSCPRWPWFVDGHSAPLGLRWIPTLHWHTIVSSRLE